MKVSEIELKVGDNAPEFCTLSFQKILVELKN